MMEIVYKKIKNVFPDEDEINMFLWATHAQLPALSLYKTLNFNILFDAQHPYLPTLFNYLPQFTIFCFHKRLI